MWISGNTWDWRGQSPSCKPTQAQSASIEHSVETADGENMAFWNESSPGTLEPIEMKAGQSIDVSITLNFSHAGLPKDWSLTAQGEKAGKITIASKDGSKSDSIPVITRAGNKNDDQSKPNPDGDGENNVTPSPVKPNPDEGNTDPKCVFERYNENSDTYEPCKAGSAECYGYNYEE